MKGLGLILFPVIFGVSLLVGGGVVLGIGIAKSHEHSQIVTRTHELEESFNNIKVDIETANLEFIATTDGSAKVVCEEKENIEHKVSVNDGILTIQYEEHMKWYERMFNFNWRTEKVKVYMPATINGDVNIELSTGAVKVPDDFTFENLNIKCSTGLVNVEANVNETLTIYSSTGDITIKDVEAKNINGKASTGDFLLENVEASEKITLNASTGHLVLKNVTANDFESKTSTGYVRFENTVIDNHMQVKASTGDIKFVDSDAKTMNIKTDTGYIKGVLLTEHIFYAKSDTGKVSVPKTTTGGIAELETDTGDIIITIKE